MPGKVKIHTVSSEEKRELLQALSLAFTVIESPQEAKNFLIDLLYPSESIMLARRLNIARMLLAGYQYDEITKKLHVGKTTITNVHRWLGSGKGGYAAILERVFREEKKAARKRARQERALDPASWENFKRKYIAYYWPEYAIRELDDVIERNMRKFRKKLSVQRVLVSKKTSK